MNPWIAVSALLLLLSAFIATVWLVQQNRWRARLNDMEQRVQTAEARQMRVSEDLRRRTRDIARLRSRLRQEQDRSDRFEEMSQLKDARCYALEQRLAEAERLRVEADKGAEAARMRENLLERQRASLKRENSLMLSEQQEQERVYQDIIRDRDETIQRLMGDRQRRSRKHSVLDNQVTLDEILPGADTTE